MGSVGARPDELRILGRVLARATDDVAWLRRRIDAAQDRARVHGADTGTLWKLAAWLDREGVDLRRRAARLDEDVAARGGLLEDFHPPGVSGGGCGSVQIAVLARRTGPDGRDQPLGEPLFASAALSCMPPVQLSRDDALQLVTGPGGTLVLASKGKGRRGAAGGAGGGGGPAPPKPTKEEVLDKLRLPHGTVPFGFKPRPDWYPENRLRWDPKQRGYVDHKDDVWRKGPSRTPGQPFEWDVQLKKDSPWEGYSKDGEHLNIDLDGRISH